MSEEPVEAELDIMMSFPQFMDQWETYRKQFEEKNACGREHQTHDQPPEMPSSGDYESVLQTRLTGDVRPTSSRCTATISPPTMRLDTSPTSPARS